MDRVILKASDGMVLTNGKTYGIEVYLAEGEDNSDNKWYEIPESEIPSFEDAELEDYQESLLEFGVDVDD